MLRLLRHRKFGGYNVVLQYIFTGKIQVFQGALQVFPAVQSPPLDPSHSGRRAGGGSRPPAPGHGEHQWSGWANGMMAIL